MATSTAIYLGDLRVQSVHERSGVQIVTDAPIDNHGKGESFSPTDLACTSLAACMLTILGIWAQEEGLALKGTTAGITKHMLENPRRIGAIDTTAFLKTTIKAVEFININAFTGFLCVSANK